MGSLYTERNDNLSSIHNLSKLLTSDRECHIVNFDFTGWQKIQNFMINDKLNKNYKLNLEIQFIF